MTTYTPRTIYFVPFLMLFFIVNSLAAHHNEPGGTKASLFSQLVKQEYQEVVLKADLHLLKLKKINPTKKEHKAEITFKNESGQTIQMDVKISTKGKYRQQFCDFPPLQLDFSKKNLHHQGYIGKFDKYKLVTHCMDKEENQQALLKEYAVYKMYNKLTPYSFRVHLLSITYQDSHDKNYQVERVAFLIEKKEEMANRLGGELVKTYGLKPRQFTQESFYNTMIFNYMIGNSDWNVRKQKNVKFVKIPNTERLILIPYDFDFAGIVQPEYIKLNSNFNQKKIEDRFCIGKFEEESEMILTINTFRQAQKNFIASYSNLPFLKKSQKKKMSKYLASFYRFLKEEAVLKAVFLEGKYEH